MNDCICIVISAPRTLDMRPTLDALERTAEQAGCSFVRIGEDTYRIRPIVQPKRTWSFLSLWGSR